MRTGTRTVFAPSLMTSAPATICGRCSRTESRTFSSWRSQSRAPRENSSYHFANPRGLLPLRSAIALCRLYDVTLLLCEERGHIAQCLLGTVFVVSILADEPL